MLFDDIMQNNQELVLRERQQLNTNKHFSEEKIAEWKTKAYELFNLIHPEIERHLNNLSGRD